MTLLPYDRNILDCYIGYTRFLTKFSLAINTTPMHAAFFGHAQILAGVQKLKGLNISGLHMPYSADWSVGIGHRRTSCKRFDERCKTSVSGDWPQDRTYRRLWGCCTPQAQFLSAQDQIWHFCRQISKLVIYVCKMQKFPCLSAKGYAPVQLACKLKT